MAEITPQSEIPAGTPNAAEQYNDNVRAANANDQALADMLGSDMGPSPVLAVRVGATVYDPDADTGQVTLPSGSSAQPMTTTARGALSGDDLYLGRLIYNTSVARVQLYGAAGWKDVENYSTTQVFTASATWTKPAGCRAVMVTVIDGGATGYSFGAGGTNASGGLPGGDGGAGGQQAERWIDAAALPAAVLVTVAGTSGKSSFGAHVTTTNTTGSSRPGGRGGTGGDSSPNNVNNGRPGSTGYPGDLGAPGGSGGAGALQYANQNSGLPGQAGPGAPGSGASGTRTTGGGGGGGGGKVNSGAQGEPPTGGAGGAGGIPGGGGGGGVAGAPGGPGARGEVIVDVYF